MAKIISKGRHVLGKLSRNCDKSAPRNCEAALTWELRDRDGKPEFAASGEVWNHLKTDIVMGGQCVDTLAALFPRDKIAQRIAATWRDWHLNGMNAGTPEQSAHVATLPEDVRRDYAKTCEALAAVGLLDVPVTPELRASALGGLPEDAKTYRYGSRWLYRAIPDDVIALIRAGFRVKGETPEPDDSGAPQEPDRDLIEEAGLSIRAEFVPWSKSRNAGEKQYSLNWRVTLVCRGRDVVTFDYSAGAGHAPANKNARLKRTATPSDMAAALRAECEKGKEVLCIMPGGSPILGAPILPETRDVIACFLRDCDAVNYGFPEWCDNLGMNADSLTARKTYDECLARAIALRAAVGAPLFEELLEANA